MITDQSGNKCYDADFYPWGTEQSPYVNTCTQNYKFTGKERDPDIFVDYLGADSTGETCRGFTRQTGRQRFKRSRMRDSTTHRA